MKSHFSLIPEQASTVASQVDGVTLALLILCVFILILVFGLVFIFCILYRKGSKSSREIKKSGQLRLEWGWTLITFFLFLGIFIWASTVYFHMHVPPQGASEITVVGKQWMWKFQHPNGKRELNELHIPLEKPIYLTMTSQDVIHSLFIPDFRIKQDVLPGRYTRTWFEANRIGEYHLFCSQYCGTEHAQMRGKVIVLSQNDYQKWLETGFSGPSSAARGARLFTQLGCISCHGDNQRSGGSKLLAPNLYGLFGSRVSLSNGQSVLADENYIRESILNPNVKIVEGYQPIMPSFAEQLNEEDVLDLIAYIKSLQGTPKTQGISTSESSASISAATISAASISTKE